MAACLGFLATAATAATPLLSFEFNETSTASVKDSVNNLTGTPAADPPLSITASPSGQAGDSAIQFEAGQYIVVDDPETKVQLDPDNPSFTLQAWVKFSGQPSGRMVFFFNNGPGGAISFSVNTDRTVFVTTLGILDASSTAAVPDDEAWHHIAVVHENGVELRYYVDGVLGHTREYTSGVIFTRTQTFFTLGGEGTGGLPYTGALDRLKITSGVLTPDQLDFKAVTGPVSDSDSDGMPNDWETLYGFNPNDPSDAALDFDKDGVTNLDEYKAGTNPTDVTKPTLVSGAVTGTFDTVTLTFSEELDPVTATNTANYTITPALAVTAATYKSKVVTLTTAAQTPGGTAYTVSVTGVTDTSKNAIVAASKVTVYSYLLTKDGALLFSYWGNIPGASPVSLLTDDARYPASPDLTAGVYSFNSRDAFPDDSHDNYGATIQGFLTPTEAGNYRFFIYSDDASALFLSSDDKEANLVQIAEETGCCNNFTEPDSPRTSEPVALVAGKKYFIQLMYKEGGGGDYGQVAWRKEGDTTPAGSLRPIASKYLSSAVDVAAPAEGAFLTQTPAPNAKKVSPATGVTIVHRDGKTEWTAANVTLKFDGTTVTPTFVKDGNLATITYTPPSLLPSGTTHRITLGYRNPANVASTMEWSFQVATYGGPTKDALHGYNGLVLGTAQQTADQGGHTGAAGDRAMDLTTKGSPVQVVDAAFLTALNAATAADELSVSLWIKKYDIADSSAIWFSSPTQSRVFQAHTPWSNANIYFDTAGCCDGTTQRINAGIDTFAGYSGDVSWWNEWRLYVFTKKADQKNVYIDGELFLNGSNTGPLSTDINQFMIGSDNTTTAGLMHGLVDDVAVYSKELTVANITALKGGTKPDAIAGVLANWDFNTVAPSAAESLKNGLTAYWSFDGNLLDSIKDFHGTGRGANPIAYTAGKEGFGQAIDLDGADQYVDITGGNENELEFPAGSMSIAGWFRVDAFDTEWQALIAKGEGSNYRIARRAATGTVAYAGGVGEGADNVPAVNDGQWHHFVAISDATTNAFGTAMYIDGVLLSVMADKPVLTANDKHLFIGENPEALNRQWNGGIDDIAIWNRVLTPVEVAALYNNGTGLALSTIPGINVPTPSTTATISRSGSNITIAWSPTGGTLESSPTLGAGATWTTVGTANPATVAIGAGNLYYRIRK